jgi:hypothetical protein
MVAWLHGCVELHEVVWGGVDWRNKLSGPQLGRLKRSYRKYAQGSENVLRVHQKDLETE